MVWSARFLRSHRSLCAFLGRGGRARGERNKRHGGRNRGGREEGIVVVVVVVVIVVVVVVSSFVLRNLTIRYSEAGFQNIEKL